MLHAKARWVLQQADAAAVRELAEAAGIDKLTAAVLAVRGISTGEEARRFLYAGEEALYDPFLLDGMQAAVTRIRRALEQREKIRIYGDYDADGVSSTALMIRLLRMLGAEFDFYIPHRVREGYGLNRGALELAKQDGVGLMITVDTGISAWEEVEFAASLGLDIIVTDHHEPPEKLPEAVAVINPKKPGCPYPFKGLCGAGVAFKLAQALLERPPLELAELAAIGTVADLMPLVDENRVLVKLGLDLMQKTDSPGLRALMEIAEVPREEVNATHIGFAIGPRLNAGGRLESADDAVLLLTAEGKEEADRLALNLDMLNKERQRIVESIVKEAMLQAEAFAAQARPQVLVLADDQWNVGVVGIVASKLLEKFYCPTLILTIDRATGMAKGSARSIAGFDIYRALTECADLLDHFGGHQAAAGMSLREENIPELRRRLAELAGAWLTDEDYSPILQADLVCGLDEVPVDGIRRLEKLEPFGMGNPAPRFVFRSLQLQDKRTMGRDKQHMKLQLVDPNGQGKHSIDAVGFSRSSLLESISPCAEIDVLGELSVNEWNGSVKPQILIKDMQIVQPQIFDWRGAQDLAARWAAVASCAQSGGYGASCSAAVILESAGIPAELSEWNASFWQADASGSLTLIGEHTADTVAPSHARDLLFYAMPAGIESIRRILGEASRAERVYAVFREKDPFATAALPTRENFKQVYAVMRGQDQNHWKADQVLSYFSKRSGLSPAMIRFIIEVFEELQFIERVGGSYRCTAAPAKQDLSASVRFRQRQDLQQVHDLLVHSTSAELCKWMLTQLRSTNQLTEVNA